MTILVATVADAPVSGALLQKLLDAHGARLDDVDLVSGAAACGSRARAYDGALVFCTTAPDSVGPAFLGAVCKALALNANVTVHPGPHSPDDVMGHLTVAGFVDCQAVNGLVKCLAPSYALGEKAALGVKRTHGAAAAAPAPSAGAWALSLGEEDELVDEDELLTEEDKVRPAPVKADDCEVGASGRKACDNCTCGRADAEARGEAVQLTQDMLDNPGAGSCGSCSLGDAFRCAGCPYRGLPAFEPGKKIQLPAGFLVADA